MRKVVELEGKREAVHPSPESGIAKENEGLERYHWLEEY